MHVVAPKPLRTFGRQALAGRHQTLRKSLQTKMARIEIRAMSFLAHNLRA
jgi:hypothetical protein